ncbi:MAG TPA: DM13 domain-containing protein [Actinomycetes bacterium]|nr:DM13 domain-containing protein [Actinomycetes bacterium]
MRDLLTGVFRSPLTWVVCIVVAAGAGFVLYQLAPWTALQSSTVNEAFPGAETPVGTRTPPSAPAAAPTGGRGPSAAPAAPRDLARGSFVSHEHDTTGTVRVVELPDGRRIVRLENFSTLNGPDLHVWLTDAPVLDGRDGWFVFDDGSHVSLGRLKANNGNQNYPVPAGTDLSKLTSVSIWCDKFNVSFGAAALSTG